MATNVACLASVGESTLLLADSDRVKITSQGRKGKLTGTIRRTHTLRVRDRLHILRMHVSSVLRWYALDHLNNDSKLN